jgi:hypothetical protein
MEIKEFLEKQYTHQANNEANFKAPMIFWNPDGVDAWLHNRKYITVLPLIQHYPDARWLTIGDGRFGSDAFFLKTHGANAIPSSISDTTLKIAVERGYFPTYLIENAEHMDSKDNEFDFVLCKESYHHFPRPALGFYEMLRVASKALILIEPIEGCFRPLDFLKNTAVKKLLRGDRSALFEPSGNFIYRLTIREVEKMMSAINGPVIAVKKFNTFYHPKLASQKNGPTVGAWLTKLAITIQNVFSAIGLMNFGLATIIIFKAPLPNALRNALQRDGFDFIDLPQNPYLA